MASFNRIVLDPAIAHGKPVIRGTRLPVTVVVGSLAGGMTFEEVQREYDLAADDIRAALKFVAELPEQESFHPLPAAWFSLCDSWSTPICRGRQSARSPLAVTTPSSREMSGWGLPLMPRLRSVSVRLELTRDLDFADVRHYPPEQYDGIVVLRLPDHSTAQEIVAVLDRFLAEPRFVENLQGRLAIVDNDRVRLRPPLD
jgi:uncharacterized protein (DUF433 family)